jgi:hypothetical protein
VDVELTLEESTVIQQALRTYCSDLRMEIVDTDNPAYRRELKGERSILEGVLAKLDSAAANAVPAADGTSSGGDVLGGSDPAGREPAGTERGTVERTEHVVIRLIGFWPNG